MLRDFCGLYNAGLQQRIEPYRRWHVSLRCAQQADELKTCRTADPEGLGRWSCTALQQVLRRLDQAYAAFFERGHGFARFRAAASANSPAAAAAAVGVPRPRAASAKIAQQRRDHLHKLMRALVSRYRGIAFEVLNLARLKRGMPARSIHDAAWALLVEFVRFKAASAGAELVLVNPRGTSQTCPACSTIRPKTLRERLHRCTCSCVLDQDVAAAEIVRRRAFS